jgi:hypothetical protein
MKTKGNGSAYSTLMVSRMVGVHRATLLRWLQSGQLPEPRHVRTVGQDIRVWSARDVARARRLREAHGWAERKGEIGQGAQSRRAPPRAGKGTRPAMKKRCEFLGGVGLEEQFRPPVPCLGEFELSSHPTGGQNRIYCDVCRPFAHRAHELAHYHANRKKIAKKNRTKRRKRAEAAGRVYRPLTGMRSCQYRDEHGKRGEGCLLKFKPKNGRQIYCGVCKKLALADAGKKWREDHAAEIHQVASSRWAALRAAAERPADWYQKPLRWRVIADVLRSQDAPMSNSEVGKQLDDGEILKPYRDGNWEAVLSSSIHPAVKLLSKVRKWVNRPGKTPVEK